MLAEGDDDKLLQFSRVVPEGFGAQQQLLLQTLLDRVKHVEGMVTNGQVDVLAFKPLQQRMAAAAGPWGNGFRAYLAGAIVEQHANDKTALQQIAELGNAAAVMLMPFASTGIGTVLEAIAIATAVTADVANAAINYKEAGRQTEVARATPLSGTELVDRAAADEKEVKATSDLVTSAVTAIIVALTLGAAGGSAVVDTIRMAKLRTVVADEGLLTKLLGQVSDKELLYRLAAKSKDATKLEGLLARFGTPAELEAVLGQAGGGAELENLLKQVPDAARLRKLLDAAGSGERLSAMISRLGSIEEVEAQLGRQAAGQSEGLIGAPALKRVAGQIEELRAHWDAITPEQRLAEAAGEVNAELQLQGIPMVSVASATSETSAGGFTSYKWAVMVEDGLVAESARGGDPGKLAKTLMHEARHAEQDFLVARLKGSEGMGVDEMTYPRSEGGLAMPRNVAEAAKAQPLPLDSPQAAFAREMSDASQKFRGTVYGKIMDRRSEAMFTLGDLKLDRAIAENRAMMQPGPPRTVGATQAGERGAGRFRHRRQGVQGDPVRKRCFCGRG